MRAGRRLNDGSKDRTAEDVKHAGARLILLPTMLGKMDDRLDHGANLRVNSDGDGRFDPAAVRTPGLTIGDGP